jgi:hypothetical protein
VKKTEQPEHDERLKGSSSKLSTEAYGGDSGISRIRTHDDLV